jgi:hypothetical protein
VGASPWRFKSSHPHSPKKQGFPASAACLVRTQSVNVVVFVRRGTDAKQVVSDLQSDPAVEEVKAINGVNLWDLTVRNLRTTLKLRGFSPRSNLGSAVSGAPLVQELQQLVRRELDLLVTPFGRSVVTGNQACAMKTTEVSVHERIARLRLICRTFCQAEVPFAVFLP